MIFEDHPSPEGIEKIHSSKLHELFMAQLMELYQGEMSFLEVLTILQDAVATEQLKKIVAQYQRNKGDQVESLQQVFVLLDLPIAGKNSRITEVMMDECKNLALTGKNMINDFVIGHMVMKISHFNQASYEWLLTLAVRLGIASITEYLDANFRREKEIDIKTVMAIVEGH